MTKQVSRHAGQGRKDGVKAVDFAQMAAGSGHSQLSP
jgi:hypothetical protein